MNNIKLNLIVIVIVSFASVDISASVSYSCREVYTSAIDYGSNSSSKLKVSNDDGKPEQSSKLKISIGSRGDAYLQGNQASAELVTVSGEQYLERTESGNIILWTFFPQDPDSKYRILVTQKSYEIFMMPMTFTSVYECR